MNEFKQIFRNWLIPESKDYRSISKKTFDDSKVIVTDNEVVFPYGKNPQSPDRFKIVNPNTKAMFFSKKEFLLEDNKLPFFNQKSFENKDYIIVTEGEWDCLSWIESGYENSVSIPNGSSSAGGVFRREFEYLSQFKNIYISFDSDEAGQKAVEDIKVIISKYKLRIINIDIEGFKDANDLLKAGLDLKCFFDNAECPSALNVVDVADFSFEDILRATPKGLTTGFISIDEILGGIRPGELTVISGDSGAGKTTLSCNIALNFCECTNKNIWISSQEMTSSKLLQKIFSIHVEYPMRENLKMPDAKMEKAKILHNKHKIFIDPDGCNMTLENVLYGLEHARYVNNVEFAVIEDLGYLAKTLKGTTIENIDTVMRALHIKAIETGIHIFLIVHPTQTFDDRGFMGMANLKGSSSIKQTANNVLIVQRCDRAYPDNYSVKDKVTVRVAKNRATGKEGLSILNYNEYYDGYSNSTLTLKEFYGLCKNTSDSNTPRKRNYK